MNETHKQILISRIIDGDGGDAEWCELEALAENDPRVWRDVAQAQRDQACLGNAIMHASSVADSIPMRFERPTVRPTIQISAWSGWAVAALVAIIASVRWSQPDTFSPTPFQPQTTGLNAQSAADAFQEYLDQGRKSGEVVGEVPAKVLLESRPAQDGQGYELVYLRQVLERMIVPEMYRVDGQDERGQPTLIRYQQPVRRSM
ncbi:MAG: hypothetical protein L0Y42_16625 [Phycisphaerales bacterium]|nr:hypothetical protein [Phycisphaerales bacterium]